MPAKTAQNGVIRPIVFMMTAYRGKRCYRSERFHTEAVMSVETSPLHSSNNGDNVGNNGTVEEILQQQNTQELIGQCVTDMVSDSSTIVAIGAKVNNLPEIKIWFLNCSLLF